MKKAGEILREARLKQDKSLTEISRLTKIRETFLISIEQGQYHKLPNPIYVRGFIANYAHALNLKPEKVLPFYRREIEPPSGNTLKKIPIPKRISRLVLTPAKFVLFVSSLALTIFLIILYVQYRNFAGQPVLQITFPPENFITEEDQIELVGLTDPRATITINGEPAKVEIDGRFHLIYSLRDGINRIKILSETEQRKQTTNERIVEKRTPRPQ